MQLVEGLLQAVYAGLGGGFHMGSDFFEPGQDLAFGEFLFRFRRLFGSVFFSRSFRGYRFGNCCVLLFFF